MNDPIILAAPEDRDPNEGHGGSYVIDPATGKRQLAERTNQGSPDTSGEPSTASTKE